MNLKTALSKTEKGTEEIETRKHKLDHRMRALLVVVNGKTTAEQLMRDFERFGDVQAMLEQLEREGFIRAHRPFLEIRRGVASAIYEALGPESDAITLEADNCRSLPELRRYVTARRGLFETALGKERGEKLWAKLNGMLD